MEHNCYPTALSRQLPGRNCQNVSFLVKRKKMLQLIKSIHDYLYPPCGHMCGNLLAAQPVFVLTLAHSRKIKMCCLRLSDPLKSLPPPPSLGRDWHLQSNGEKTSPFSSTRTMAKVVYRITSPNNCISRLPGLTNRRLSNNRKPSRWHRQPFWISGPKYLVFPPPDTPIPLDIYLAGCFSPKLLNSSPQKGLPWLRRLKQDRTPPSLPRVHSHVAALLM